MRVTILGTANAWGPNPFSLNWDAALLQGQLSDGQIVQFRQHNTSLLIRPEQGEPVVVDCGPDFCRQLWQFHIETLGAILLTHSHWDHIGGLDYLHHYRYTPKVLDRKPLIPVYATEPSLQDVLQHRGFHYLVTNAILQPYPIQPGCSFSLGSLHITPFAVEHGQTAPGAVGFVFEEISDGQAHRVLYSGDFWAFTPPTDDFFCRDFDLVILECNQWYPRNNGHISLMEILDLLAHGPLSHANIRQLTLVHFSEYGPNGTRSSYQDWRDAIIAQLKKHNLTHLVRDEDKLVAYEGLTFHY